MKALFSRRILFLTLLLLPHASPAQTIVHGIGQMVDSRPRLLKIATSIDSMLPFVRGWAKPILLDLQSECHLVADHFTKETGVSLTPIHETFELYWRIKNSKSFFQEALPEVNRDQYNRILVLLEELALAHGFYERTRPQMIHAGMRTIGHLLEGILRHTQSEQLKSSVTECLLIVSEAVTISSIGDIPAAWRKADQVHRNLKALLPELLNNRSPEAFGRAKELLALNAGYESLTRAWKDEDEGDTK
jgi:hypothetical protein